MRNPRLANTYAKSLVDIATEQNQLDAVCAEIKWLKSVCKSNPDFVSVLTSPVIKGDKKAKIIEAVTNGRIGKLTGMFINLLITKGRENVLPQILDAFVEQFNVKNNIQTVKLTTAHPIADELKEAILANVRSASNAGKIEVETAVNPDLIGGFVLETQNKLVDASVLYDLNTIKKQFLNNDFVHRIQ